MLTDATEILVGRPHVDLQRVGSSLCCAR
ncbi:putative leader peptide [Propioniciclava sp.]